jgi:hypothetical protein
MAFGIPGANELPKPFQVSKMGRIVLDRDFPIPLTKRVAPSN